MAEYPIITNGSTIYNKMLHQVNDNKKNVLNSIDNTLYLNTISFTTNSLTSTKINDYDVDNDIINTNTNNVSGATTQSDSLSSMNSSLTTQTNTHNDNVSGTTTNSNKLTTLKNAVTTQTNNVDNVEQKKIDLENAVSNSSTKINNQTNNLVVLEPIYKNIINFLNDMRKGVNKLPGVDLHWVYDGGYN